MISSIVSVVSLSGAIPLRSLYRANIESMSPSIAAFTWAKALSAEFVTESISFAVVHVSSLKINEPYTFCSTVVLSLIPSIAALIFFFASLFSASIDESSCAAIFSMLSIPSSIACLASSTVSDFLIFATASFKTSFAMFFCASVTNSMDSNLLYISPTYPFLVT